MEHRKRSVSSVLDEELSPEKKERTLSISIDDEIEQFSLYMYDTSFSIKHHIFRSLKNLISVLYSAICCAR